MTRKKFFAALASVPLVGKLLPAVETRAKPRWNVVGMVARPFSAGDHPSFRFDDCDVHFWCEPVEMPSDDGVWRKFIAGDTECQITVPDADRTQWYQMSSLLLFSERFAFRVSLGDASVRFIGSVRRCDTALNGFQLLVDVDRDTMEPVHV